jgi:hypothetical protein
MKLIFVTILSKSQWFYVVFNLIASFCSGKVMVKNRQPYSYLFSSKTFNRLIQHMQHTSEENNYFLNLLLKVLTNTHLEGIQTDFAPGT